MNYEPETSLDITHERIDALEAKMNQLERKLSVMESSVSIVFGVWAGITAACFIYFSFGPWIACAIFIFVVFISSSIFLRFLQFG